MVKSIDSVWEIGVCGYTLHVSDETVCGYTLHTV